VRSVSAGQAGIGQIADEVSCIEIAIEDVDFAAVEIRSQQESALPICH